MYACIYIHKIGVCLHKYTLGAMCAGPAFKYTLVDKRPFPHSFFFASTTGPCNVTYTHTHTYTHTYTHSLIHTHTRPRARTRTTHTHMHAYIRIYIHTHKHTHTHTHTQHTHTHTHTGARRAGEGGLAVGMWESTSHEQAASEAQSMASP